MTEIPLTQGKFALVDDCDSHLAKYKWCLSRGYAVRGWNFGIKKQKIMRMHHCVIGQPLNGLVVDHIDGDQLNNRRENLRVVTHRENMSNQKRKRDGATSSDKIGVYFYKRTGKWLSRITVNGKRKFLGYFDTEMGASNAYAIKRRDIR